jgi:hypothetical protein
MSLPTSLRSYEDCRALYEAACADPKGVRARLGTYEACISMRTRMHYFRSLDREANAKTYPAGHHMSGISAYDGHIAQIIKDEDGMFWLYIQLRVAPTHIEPLSEVGDLIDVDGEEVQLIENRSEPQ